MKSSYIFEYLVPPVAFLKGSLLKSLYETEISIYYICEERRYEFQKRELFTDYPSF